MIILDARMAGYSGIGTYIQGLLSGLADGQKAGMTLLGDPKFLTATGTSVVDAPEPIYGLREQITLPRRVAGLSPRLFHAPHFNAPLLLRTPLVVTVHDVIHLLFPRFSRRSFAKLYARVMIPAAVRKAARVITVSERTKRDLADMGLPVEKVRVIPEAADPRFRRLPEEETRPVMEKHGLGKGYLLFVGNLRHIKNVPRLLRAYGRAREKRPDLPPLVLAGRDQMPEVTATFRDRDGFVFLGEVAGSDLPALYNGAGAFIFPSLYEGFGLPPLEAMACGCPVVASTGGSLPEVLGDAALLVDPEDEEGLGAAMERVVSDETLRRDLRSKGLARAATFSWAETARRTWAVYEELL